MRKSRISGDIRIAIVGPCAAGKSSLALALQERGLQARQIVQEHSFVPAMWQHFSRPEVLIYLDASFEVCSQRKKLNWLPWEYAEQNRRLEHARKHCQIYIQTNDLTLNEVLNQVLSSLEVAYPSGEGV